MTCLETFQLQNNPRQILSVPPYVLILLSTSIEIRITLANSVMQIIDISNPSYLECSDSILLFNENNIWRLLPYDMEDQVLPSFKS